MITPQEKANATRYVRRMEKELTEVRRDVASGRLSAVHEKKARDNLAYARCVRRLMDEGDGDPWSHALAQQRAVERLEEVVDWFVELYGPVLHELERRSGETSGG